MSKIALIQCSTATGSLCVYVLHTTQTKPSVVDLKLVEKGGTGSRAAVGGNTVQPHGNGPDKETLQRRDVEGSRQELIRGSLSPSRGTGSEGLRVLCSYLEQMSQGLRDAGPPAPLVYRHEDLVEEVVEEDVEHVYYRIQEPRVNAEEDNIWWVPGLIHPCGLP